MNEKEILERAMDIYLHWYKTSRNLGIWWFFKELRDKWLKGYSKKE